MKRNHLALALAAALSLGVAPYATAQQKGMDMVKTMDADKDGMISKSEFMKKMEAMWDSMDKGKKGRLTPEDVQKITDQIGKTYGYSN